MSVEEKLQTVRYRVDRTAHIRLDKSICKECDQRVCLLICPAGCYALIDGEVTFSYEGCLECGACSFSCDRGAVDWNYPRGGFGVCYRLT